MIKEQTDGSICPACLSDDIGFDTVSYLSGVRAPDGYAERLTDEMGLCNNCGENFTIATRGGVQYTPETLMQALKDLIL